MSAIGEIRSLGYVCESCKQTRNLMIDADVHLNRRELTINGLASYIDVHADREGKRRHGIKIFVDKNFAVRTNNVLKIKAVSPPITAGPAIPMPGIKSKNLTTKIDWLSWNELKLELKTENLNFYLEDTLVNSNTIDTTIESQSELGSVVCTLKPVVLEDQQEKIRNITGWITNLCNAIELASSLHVDLIPEIIRYIDHHTDRPITYNDEIIIKILVDKAAILIPDKSTMANIAKHGPAIKLIGLEAHSLSIIAKKLCEQDKFSMVDIQKILETHLEKESELEEEMIVVALYYLLSFDAFDYKLSYLQTSP